MVSAVTLLVITCLRVLAAQVTGENVSFVVLLLLEVRPAVAVIVPFWVLCMENENLFVVVV